MFFVMIVNNNYMTKPLKKQEIHKKLIEFFY